MEAIAEMAAVYRCLRSQGEDFQDQYSLACEYADRLEVLVRGGASHLIEFIWSVRSLAIELRIAEWAGWAGLDDQQWLPRLQRAAKLVQERSESERDSEEGFAPSRLQLAEIALIVALRRRDEEQLRAALRFLGTHGRHDALLSAHHQMRVGIQAAYICQLFGDEALARRWMARAIAVVEQLEPLAAAPLSARIALNRLRYGLAGEAAALADEPEDLAWLLHSVTHSPTSRDDSARHAFLLNLASIVREAPA